MTRTPLNIICRRTQLDAALESYFIKETLLAKVGRPIRVMAFEDKAAMPLLGDALVISFGTSLAPYLRAARERGCRNVGLFHMADERGSDDRGFYADADYVIRHYWHEAAFAKPSERSLGVVWVPNGYRNGVGPVARETMLPMRDRTIMGFFAGVIEGRTLSDERRGMAQAIESAKLPFTIIETKGFGQGLGPTAYAAYLSSARFALTPSGNSPETIRLYDAFEAGAIPVMLRNAFVAEPRALGNPPVLLLDRWSELGAAYAPYAAADAPAVVEKLQAMQDELAAWWQDFVARQQQKVATLIETSFARSAAR